MKKKMLMMMATVGVSVLTLVAFMASASACMMGYYQPEEPKCFQEK